MYDLFLSFTSIIINYLKILLFLKDYHYEETLKYQRYSKINLSTKLFLTIENVYMYYSENMKEDHHVKVN